MSPSSKPETGKPNGNGAAMLRIAAVVISILVGAAALGLLPRISDFYTRGEAQAAHAQQKERLDLHKEHDGREHDRIMKQHREDVQEMKGDIKTILREIRRRR